MVYVAAAFLAIYNALFFVSRHLSDAAPGLSKGFKNFHEDYTGFLIVLELIGVVSLFVDLVATYEKRPKGLMRNLWTVLVALLVFGFLFKLYVVYMDSSVLSD